MKQSLLLKIKFLLLFPGCPAGHKVYVICSDETVTPAKTKFRLFVVYSVSC